MSTYELTLDDKLSGPARSAAATIARLDASLRGLDSALGRTTRQFAQLGAGMDVAGRPRREFDATRNSARGAGLAAASAFVTIATGAVQAATSVGRLALSFGRSTIELMSFRESSIAAMEAVTGSSEEAGRSFRNAMAMANQTPLDTRDVVGAQTRFAVAGFSERERTPLIGAMSDLQSAIGTTAGNSFALVVSQMRSADNMDRGDLRQLLNAGVNTGAVLDSIARQMNVRGPDQRAVRARVLRMLSQRQVRGDVGIQAALDAINQRYDRGAGLGSFARAQSQTLTGALSNAQNAWGNLVMSMRSADIPGVQMIRDAVLAITDALGPKAPMGAALSGIVADLFNVVGRGLFGDVNASTLGGFAETLQEMRPLIRDVAGGFVALFRGFGGQFMSTVRPVFDAFTQFTDGGAGSNTAITMERIGRAMGFLAGAFVWGVAVIGGIVTTFVAYPERMAAAWEESIAWFRALPGRIVDGFIETMQQEWQRILATMDILASTLPDPVRRALGIRSPSRVFAELGMDTARGFEIGLDRGAAGVGRAVGDLVTIPQVPTAAAFGVRPSISIPINVVVQAREGEDPEQMGRRIGRGLMVELADVIALLNAGMAPAEASS